MIDRSTQNDQNMNEMKNKISKPKSIIKSPPRLSVATTPKSKNNSQSNVSFCSICSQ